MAPGLSSQHEGPWGAVRAAACGRKAIAQATGSNVHKTLIFSSKPLEGRSKRVIPAPCPQLPRWVPARGLSSSCAHLAPLLPCQEPLSHPDFPVLFPRAPLPALPPGRMPQQGPGDAASPLPAPRAALCCFFSPPQQEGLCSPALRAGRAQPLLVLSVCFSPFNESSPTV